MAMPPLICMKTVPQICLHLFCMSQAAKKAELWRHIEWLQYTSCWNQIKRNKFAFANDFSKSFTIHWEYLTSHGLQMKPDSVWLCKVTKFQDISCWESLCDPWRMK